MVRRLPFFLILIFFFTGAIGQDTAYQWNVTSKKIDDHTFDIIFSSNGNLNWQLYSPNQKIIEDEAVRVEFPDSSIKILYPFSSSGNAVSFTSAIFDNAKFTALEGPLSISVKIQFPGPVPSELLGSFYYFYGKGAAFYPGSIKFATKLEGGVSTSGPLKISTIDINKPVLDCGDEGTQGKGLLTIFLLGLLGGLIALLTPCVFPMIPLTVSFFTKKSAEKQKGIGNAVLYGFFIFLIYVLLTVPFHIAGKTNPDIFNNISTNIWLNLIFFIIFVVFALSFFGLFEITIPSGVAGKIDSRSSIGNWGGIFFMALTLAIVSFSCTGPILGTLLAGVADKGAWPLTVGAAGFGLALGLPFALFAMFPRWLQSLPKSGGWLTDVKVVLGFIELALAIKFLANADNVKQWGILKREIFIGSWVLIGLGTVLYLLGWLKIGHSAPVKKFSITRIVFILFFGAATIYLIPGLMNSPAAKLTLISGFPPPVCYSVFKDPVNCDKPLTEYEKAVELAKKTNKPILIDFTGWACVNCRKMEENVWTKPQVEVLMKNDFILVSLYVDERTKLPITEQTKYQTKSGAEKSIITVGDKWTTFQTENFDATSQPQYIILSPDERVLVKSKYYTPDADEFAAWLQCGLGAYKKTK